MTIQLDIKRRTAPLLLAAIALGCGAHEDDIAAWDDEGTLDQEHQAATGVDPGETLLVGTQAVAGTTVSLNAGVVDAHPIAAVASGTVAKLKAYIDSTNTATAIQLGLYAQSSSAPGALVASCSIPSVTNGGWNECAVSGSPSVTSGATYYVAVLSPSGGNAVKVRRAGGTSSARWKSGQSALPNPYGTPGGTFSAGLLSFTAVAASSAPDPVTTISCPPGYAEVFRDDFNGTSVDTTKWNVANQNSGEAEYIRLTHMLAANVSVSAGTLKIASKRHCSDPYPTVSPEHPGQCGGTNYYSGGLVTGKTGYAAGKGMMIFRAKMPSPVPGYFPALWARNTHPWQTNTYGELDLIEKWWDPLSKGVHADDDLMAETTWIYDGANTPHTTGNVFGPYAGSSTGFHVWEVEWDAGVTPATIKYYYRDTPTSTRHLLRTVTYSSGWNRPMTDALMKAAIDDTGCSPGNCGFRPYVDFAVQPDTTYHVSPDTATTYDPSDLEVDSVITCDG
ncbi:glycoside hydrolase family 16 protein [Sorangium sp. So ce1389]|uniref:glycoside hydrolase family 16 protein n=1 Tax=Sorangium sp. So ce1389 TaxID=3133336 RepID=UPI003F5FBAAF